MKLKSLVLNLLKFLLLILQLLKLNKAESSESETEPESAIQVEVVEPRRSGRNKKQTKFFGNPLLYKIAPRFIPEILQQMSETLKYLQERYSTRVEF